MRKKEEASTEADADGDGDKKRSAEDMKEKVSLRRVSYSCVVCVVESA
jgi:hypothetical protein